MDQFYSRVQKGTESFLTWRARRKHVRREKQKAKNPVLDWLEAFLWAAGVVLLLNQYLLQAYQIPSKSMMNTLQIGDRIFVNKLIYGPELIPGMLKMPGFTEPQRGSVIIFENPSYLSKGPGFDILQRVLYMLTLSTIDIDRDELGQPRPHFLIKRAVGVAGDRLRIRNGDMQIMPEGTDSWMSEAEFKKLSGLSYSTRRLIQPEAYAAIRASAITEAYRYAGLPVPAVYRKTAAGKKDIVYSDVFTENYWRMRTLHAADPQDGRTRAYWMRENLGWYVPENHVFPMGDNRDNSRDARFFGPVPFQKVLGKAMIKYWPVDRFGPIR